MNKFFFLRKEFYEYGETAQDAVAKFRVSSFSADHKKSAYYAFFILIIGSFFLRALTVLGATRNWNLAVLQKRIELIYVFIVLVMIYTSVHIL